MTTADIVSWVSIYAVDQCILITRRQNIVAGEANLVLGGVTLGLALATYSYVLSGSDTDRTAATALAGTITANNTSKSFLPANQSVPVKAMLDAGLAYAEDVGFTKGEFGDQLYEDTALRLARVHDAVFAGCTANAYGLRPPASPHRSGSPLPPRPGSDTPGNTEK